jgi:lipid-A-disaccharide synthase
MMLASAAKIHASRPETRFLVAAFNERHAKTICEMIAGGPHRNLPLDVHHGFTPEIIELAEACVAVSGSVSLEIMVRAKPTVIVFRMKPLTFWLARRLVKVPFFTLVNLLANRPLFPEFATSGDVSGPVSEQVIGWLSDPQARALVVAQLERLRGEVAQPGACQRAAEFLTKQLISRASLKEAA